MTIVSQNYNNLIKNLIQKHILLIEKLSWTVKMKVFKLVLQLSHL